MKWQTPTYNARTHVMGLIVQWSMQHMQYVIWNMWSCVTNANLQLHGMKWSFTIKFTSVKQIAYFVNINGIHYYINGYDKHIYADNEHISIYLEMVYTQHSQACSRWVLVDTPVINVNEIFRQCVFRACHMKLILYSMSNVMTLGKLTIKHTNSTYRKTGVNFHGRSIRAHQIRFHIIETMWELWWHIRFN